MGCRCSWTSFFFGFLIQVLFFGAARASDDERKSMEFSELAAISEALDTEKQLPPIVNFTCHMTKEIWIFDRDLGREAFAATPYGFTILAANQVTAFGQTDKVDIEQESYRFNERFSIDGYQVLPRRERGGRLGRYVVEGRYEDESDLPPGRTLVSLRSYKLFELTGRFHVSLAAGEIVRWAEEMRSQALTVSMTNLCGLLHDKDFDLAARTFVVGDDLPTGLHVEPRTNEIIVWERSEEQTISAARAEGLIARASEEAKVVIRNYIEELESEERRQEDERRKKEYEEQRRLREEQRVAREEERVAREERRLAIIEARRVLAPLSERLTRKRKELWGNYLKAKESEDGYFEMPRARVDQVLIDHGIMDEVRGFGYRHRRWQEISEIRQSALQAIQFHNAFSTRSRELQRLVHDVYYNTEETDEINRQAALLEEEMKLLLENPAIALDHTKSDG